MESITTETEIWKDIPDFENRYQASNLGRIRSILWKIPRILTLRSYRNSPYFKVCLIDSTGRKRWFRVHRLIYITFTGPIPKGLVIDHIDGNKHSNILSNLRAVSEAVNRNNPNTVQNNRIRYHKPGEHERRSEGQKRRFQRPDQLEFIRSIGTKAREVRKRNREQRLRGQA